MLIINVINTLPIEKLKKFEGFDELSQLRTTIEKNRKKKKIFQNKCVSSQNMQYEKRRGRYRSGYTLPSPQLAVSQAGPAAFFHGVIQTIGKTPLTTTNVLPSTPAIFSQMLLRQKMFSLPSKKVNRTIHQNR